MHFFANQVLLDAVRAGIMFDEETEVTVRRPILDRLENSVSGVMLKSIYPTELVYLIGKNLEFDHGNEQEGVFFVGAKGKETRATFDDMGLQTGTLAGEVTVEPAPTPGSGE